MSDKKYYMDPRPLGSGTIVTERQGFLARPFDVPEDVAEGLKKLTNDFFSIQLWLSEVYQRSSSRTYKPEIPDQVKEIVCPVQPSVEQPSKPATAATSKKRSPKPSKKTAASSSTSPKKES